MPLVGGESGAHVERRDVCDYGQVFGYQSAAADVHFVGLGVNAIRTAVSGRYRFDQFRDRC